MSLDEPKIKHQKCKICDHVIPFTHPDGNIVYWCWEGNDAYNYLEVDGNDRCHKWVWNGVDEK